MVTRNSAATNPTDILYAETGQPPYIIDASAIAKEARALAKELASRASQFDVDEEGDRNVIIGQQAIVSFYQQHISASEESVRRRRAGADKVVLDTVADLRQADSSIDADPKHNVITGPLDKATDAVREVTAGIRRSAAPVIRDAADAQAARNAFHRDHPVKPPARYSSKPLTRIAWITVAVMFEIMVNGYFFLNASNNGLIGSLFEVIFFAPINVAAAVIMGLVAVRYARHRDSLPRIAGLVGTAALTIFILLFNVYLAAVRLSLQLDLHLNVASALAGIFSSNVLSVMNYQSFAVLISGLFWAGFAGWEAYRLLDPYPGYTACYRRWEQTRAELHEVQQAHAEALDEIRDRYISILEENLRHYTQSSVDLGRCREVVSGDIARHSRLLKWLCDDCQEVLHEFRAIYSVHPAHAAHDLPPAPELDTGEEFQKLDELNLTGAEADRIIARLSRLSHETARQLSLYIVTSQEQVPQTLRDIRQDVLRGGRSHPDFTSHTPAKEPGDRESVS